MTMIIGGLEIKSCKSFFCASLMLAAALCVSGSVASVNQASGRLRAVAVSGKSVDLSPSHRWRVIYFWSSVCPCVSACEHYSFIPLGKKYKGKVSFYAIATNGYDLQMPRKQLAYDIAERHLPYPVLLDKDHSITKYFDAKITPQTFVLDPAGHVVFDGMPDDSRRFLYQTNVPKRGKKGQVPESYLAKALAQAVAGKPVTETPLKEAGCSIAW